MGYDILLKNQMHTGCLDDVQPLKLFYSYISTSVEQQIITKSYCAFKVRYIPVADSRNPALVNNFVEVAGEGSEFGLMCYDDVDAKTLEVLCRSSSPSQFFLAHRYNTHTSYKG